MPITKLLALALTLAFAGCTHARDPELVSSPTSYYYTSGGVTEYRDSDSGAWCTSAKDELATTTRMHTTTFTAPGSVGSCAAK